MRLKSTSKEKQKEFIEHLRGLFENLSELVPECLEGGMFCNFNAYRKKVEALQHSENYDKFTKTADQFLSGLSETHRIMESDSAPIFGMLKTPYGTIEYAKRGVTDDSVLVGIQHYDNPLWRMLAFSSLAKTKGSRIYSSGSFYLGSCKNSSPGVDFFKSVLKDENIQFDEKDGDLEIPGTGHSMEILHLNTVKFRFYENSSYNLLQSLLRHMITPDIGSDFSFRFDFIGDLVQEIPTQALSLYMAGKMNDRTFIRESTTFRVSEAIRRGYYIIGDTGYRTAEELVEKYPFKYVPEDIIVTALNSYGKGISMDAFSERKVLETIWPTTGKAILAEMFPDEDSSTFSSLKGSPMDQIDSLSERSRIAEIKSDIEIKAWSQDSQYLVDIIRNYFTLGREKALREAEKSMGNSNVQKAIFYAFLDCIGETRNREWQFTDTERDLSWKIKPYISRILEKGSDVIKDEMENIRVFIR